MFPRMNITTPLPTFAYGTPQYSAGVGFGGINSMLPYVTSPSPVPYPVIGPSPYAVQPGLPYPQGPLSAGISPISPISPFGAGISPFGAGISPFGAGISPFAAGISPFAAGISPFAAGTSPFGAGISPFGAGISPFAAGISPFSAINPFSAISPISPWYNSPLSWSPYAQAQATPAYPAIHPALAALAHSAFSSPATCVDPTTGAVVPQPYPAAQSLLPIRPLIAAAQADPVQIAALCGMAAPSMVDPYSVMPHMQAPVPVSPVGPMMRSPLYMSPVASPMVGLPYTVTAGIPC
jgi:hypothetical protein